MYAAWLDNICLESTSLAPKGFQNVLLISITIFICYNIHFFFSNTSSSKISVTLNRDYLRPSITWQKERACNVLISEFLAPSGRYFMYGDMYCTAFTYLTYTFTPSAWFLVALNLCSLLTCYSVSLFPSYSVSLLHCYSVTLLPCYLATLLSC